MLQIIKLSTKTWKHVDTNDGAFILTKFYAKLESNEFLIVETYGAKRRKYLISEIEVYDIGGTAETFANFEDLFLRLEVLKYPAFYADGEFTFNPSEYDLTEFANEDVNPFVRQNEVLSNDIADYATATLPLSDTDKLLVNQGGTFKEVAKSELGGNEIGDVHRVNFYVMSSTEGSGLLFDGLVAINRFTEIGTRSFISPSGTSRLLSLYFQNYLSATTTGALCGIKQINNADGIYRQGFDNWFVFGNNDTNSNCDTTVGHYSLLSAIPNLAKSSFTGDFVGVGNDVGDTNLSFYAHRVSASGQTASYVKVDCGVNFPAHDTTSAYLLRMEAPQTEIDTDRFVKLTITNLITGATFTHTFPYTETPILSRTYAATVIRSNRNTGVATNIKFGKIQVIRKMF